MKRVFIVGCPRSGTTLLQGLLAAHRDIYSFTESHFLDFGVKRAKQSHFYYVSRKAGELVEKFLQENKVPAELTHELLRKLPKAPLIPGTRLAEWVTAFVDIWDALAGTAGAQIWLEKTPDHLNRLALVDRFVDLMVPFRNLGYYHPDFNGSFSIKAVLPALFPGATELDYKNLEIQDGGMAMDTFANLHKIEDPGRREEIRNSLIAYCRLDTLAMVRIWEKLVDTTQAKGQLSLF